MADLAARIEQAFERRAQITPKNVDGALRNDVDEAIAMLDSGEARVA
jgi:2,3,4,5-tetrahydropyridine-2-carboxylate N-succinyltransferase